MLWLIRLLLKLSAESFRNHGWGNPVVWISSTRPQTARVQLLARHLSPTSGLQRVLLCETEKKLPSDFTPGICGAEIHNILHAFV